MEAITHLLESILGLSLRHFIFILMGAITYILDKYNEQNLKNKLATKGVSLNFWGEYMFTAETMTSFIVTIVLSIFATGIAVDQLPERPMITAVGAGIAAYGGAAILRTQMKKYQYSKEIKAQAKEEEGTNEP